MVYTNVNVDYLFRLMAQEKKRQLNTLELIPSENFVSNEVLKALGSVLTNKYSEGYPGKRYYGGNEWIDKIEVKVRKLALEVFGLDENKWSVNVQPYSGTPANYAVYFALLKPGDVLMGMDLSAGGHLSHGFKVTYSGRMYRSVLYGVGENGWLDYGDIERLAIKYKPKLIVAGASAYSRVIEFDKFRSIADKVGAFLMVDMAHIAGLVAAGVHPSPFPWADVVTTTTHKTLRGPRGAMIFTRKNKKVDYYGKEMGLDQAIDKAVFPGMQGGPHNHQIMAIGVALAEALSPKFKDYASQIVTNAKVMATELVKRGYEVVSGGTDNHLMLVDLSSRLGAGWGGLVEKVLELSGITVNKNVVPNEKSSAFWPSGIRLGTPAVTTRGMKEKEMVKIVELIDRVVGVIKPEWVKGEKPSKELVNKLVAKVVETKITDQVLIEVERLTADFPLFGW